LAARQIRGRDFASLRKVLSKTVTENQLLILSGARAGSETITQLLVRLSGSAGVPLSTLKSSAKTLRELELIDYGGENGNNLAEPTRLGNLLLSVLLDSND
jgi:hypothetical protein